MINAKVSSCYLHQLTATLSQHMPSPDPVRTLTDAFGSPKHLPQRDKGALFVFEWDAQMGKNKSCPHTQWLFQAPVDLLKVAISSYLDTSRTHVVSFCMQAEAPQLQWGL